MKFDDPQRSLRGLRRAGLTVGVALSLALGACATTNHPDGQTPRASTGQSGSPGSEAVTQAVTSPLSDLNLVHAPIPAVLRTAAKSPYAVPADSSSCDTLGEEVRALDEVLGSDLDTPPSTANPGLVERGAKEVGNAAVGALKNTAEGLVPFRGWVRKLSGAERYSKEVASAIAAGTVRRAYLKGVGEARGCAAPAAPSRRPEV
jgi:hypothetical protein